MARTQAPDDRTEFIRRFQELARTDGHTDVIVDGVFGEVSGAAYVAMRRKGALPEDLREGLKAEIAASLPRPKDVEKAYGHLEVTDRLNEAGRPTGACILLNLEWSANLRRYKVPVLGDRVLFHRKAAGSLLAIGAEVEHYLQEHPGETWRPESVQTYPGYPRHICWDPDRALSMHSWCIALDTDPSTNRMGHSGWTNPDWYFQIFRDFGWACGVDWNPLRKKDPMHVEAVRR